MTATVAGIHLGLDTHANRPAANTVPDGSLYSCSTHGLIYKSDYGGNSWATWRASTAVADILDLTTAETDDTLVLAPDGAGGVEFRAETGGGGGGVTSAFLGYNTIGGSTESATFLRVYHKKITTVGACVLQNVGIYWKETSDSLQTVRLALFADNSGAAGDLLATTTSPVLAPTNNSSFASNARWMAFPLTYSLAATTDYWIGFMFVNNGSAAVQLYYDAGSDPKWDSGGDFITDGGRYTASSTSRKYSLRALVIS